MNYGKKNQMVKEIRPVSKPEPNFHIYKEFNNGGRIEIMNDYKKANDYNDLITIARYFAIDAKVVQMPTPIHYKDKIYNEVYGKLKDTPYYKKCPDLIIDGQFYEYESYLPPFKKNKIHNMYSNGFKQSDRIIINNNKGTTKAYLLNQLYRRFIENKTFNGNIKELLIYEKGKLITLYKRQ
jgi:antitoxin component YwqK of YwqJK toxin-antitoxin module